MAEFLEDELEITAVNQLEVTEAYGFFGSAQDELPGALLIGGAVVDRDFAAENGLDIGSSFEIKTPTGPGRSSPSVHSRTRPRSRSWTRSSGR